MQEVLGGRADRKQRSATATRISACGETSSPRDTQKKRGEEGKKAQRAATSGAGPAPSVECPLRNGEQSAARRGREAGPVEVVVMVVGGDPDPPSDRQHGGRLMFGSC